MWDKIPDENTADRCPDATGFRTDITLLPFFFTFSSANMHAIQCLFCNWACESLPQWRIKKSSGEKKDLVGERKIEKRKTEKGGKNREEIWRK